MTTATEPHLFGLRVTTSLPSSTLSSPSPRDARLVHSTLTSSRIENDLNASSRSNHTPSLSETTLFTCSSVRMPTTTSFAPESGSPADSLVTENSEPLQGANVLINRAITAENDRRERLIQLVANQLTQAKLWSTVGEKAALFTDTLLWSAEELTPGQI